VVIRGIRSTGTGKKRAAAQTSRRYPMFPIAAAGVSILTVVVILLIIIVVLMLFGRGRRRGV